MTRVRVAAVAAAALVIMSAPPAAAQGLSSTSGASLAIATLTETDYVNGYSGSSGSYTLTTSCSGSGSAGCRLFLQYGTNSQGQQLDMQYAVVSLGSSDCDGAVANASTWIDVQPTSVVLTTPKNRSCVATLRFRVNPVSWSLYTSPGPPGGAYRQRLTFLFTRP
jgi:hypothetical protein